MNTSRHDQWLERPYRQADQKLADFEQFCEAQGFAFDDPAAEQAFAKAEIEAEIEIDEEVLANLTEEKDY